MPARHLRFSALLLALLVLGSACNRGSPQSGTTTTISIRSLDTTTTTESDSTATTEDPAAGQPTTVPGIPGYTIVGREQQEGGDEVVVVLEEADEEYTARDIKNVVDDLIERFAPIGMAHITGSQEAASAVMAEDPNAAQEQELERNYFARLEEGTRLVYLGPYADEPTIIIGS